MPKSRARDASSLVGRRFGEFVVKEPLSKGGFGMVFRAEQPALAREAVIKVLHMQLLASETVVQRFLREARLASRLDHPYAAHTYAFGAESDGVLWIAYELVRGTPLDKLLDAQGRLPLERYVPLLDRLCEVVHTAHEQGIIHRDIKPANVMVLSRAGRLLPKLLDLGIAKIDDDADSSQDITARQARPRLADSFSPGKQILSHAGSGASALDATMDSTDPRASAVADTADLSSGAAPGIDETLPGDTPQSEPPPLPESADGVTRPPRAVTHRVASAPGWPMAQSTPATLSVSGSAEQSLRLTLDGASMGSPLYMAPEQWSDAAQVDARTDVYSLGVMSYEAVTGRPPFLGANQMEVAAKHAEAPVPPLGEGFPPELDAVLARAMAKDAKQRYASALELAAAFREASGIGVDAVAFARLDEVHARAVMAEMPQPIAQAVAAMDGARSPRQARDALWQLVRVVTRLVGIIALASHSHVRADLSATDPDVREGLRKLRQRSMTNTSWLELSRDLAAPFEGMREAYPVPELIDVLFDDGVGPLDQLVSLQQESEHGGGSEEEVRELLDRCIPLVDRMLIAIGFLSGYRLVTTGDATEAEEWMGLRRAERVKRHLTGVEEPSGRAFLVDADGAPVVSLWPYIQVAEPAPGSPSTLFLLEGRGRRGARLVALPDAFEREDEELWEAFRGMLSDSLDDSGGSVAADEICPFPGLSAFSSKDAGSFFGRERETEAFLNRLRISPLLAVVGPSGVGKSSFVQAGVIPGLPDQWQAVTVRPGPAPLVSLSHRLAELGVDTADLRQDLKDHPGALGSALRAWASARKVTLLLVVDQLEELFTLCEDAGERALYAEALIRSARSAEDPVRIVFTLRDDFLVRAESLDAFRSRLAQGLQILTTPPRSNLRRILVQPLRRAGYEFDDPGLPDEMVEALEGTPGALALLSFTASKLWELRDRRFKQIGHKAYHSLGGVGGALAKHAEDTLSAMTSEEQRLAREVFRHVVTSEGTRAVLTRKELFEVLDSHSHAESVVEKLFAGRLLVISDDAAGERVEITHEALLSAWPRLVTWQREDAEGARLRDQLRAAARQWDERGRASGLLWRGDALAEYRLWRARYPGQLTEAERAFAEASMADARRGKRLRALSVGATIVGLAAVAVISLFQNTRVEKQKRLAQASEQKVQKSADEMRELLMSQYQGQGRRLLLADDPLLALAYLYEAAKLGARGSAHDLLISLAVAGTTGLEHSLAHDNAVTRAGFSPDGKLVGVAAYDAGGIWNATTGESIHRIERDGGFNRVAWRPDGQRLALASNDGAVVVIDVNTGEMISELAQSDGATAQAIAYSPDSESLFTVDTFDAVRQWDGTSGQLITVLHAGEPGGFAFGDILVFSADGRRVAAGDKFGAVRVWEVATARQLAELAPASRNNRVTALAFVGDGGRLVAAVGAEATMWDVAARRPIHRFQHEEDVYSVSVAPDDQHLVTSSTDRTAAIWHLASGRRLHRLNQHKATVFDTAWSPDSKTVATASDDGVVMLWDGRDGRLVARRVGHLGPIRDVRFDSAGRRLVTASLDGTARVWTTEPGIPVDRLVGHQGHVWVADFATEGHHVVSFSADQTVRIWDRTTGRELLQLEAPAPVTVMRVAPDGNRLATFDVNNQLRVWDVRSGSVLAQSAGHGQPILDLAWHPRGDRLVSSLASGGLEIWSADSGEKLTTIQGEGGPSYGVAFTAREGRIVTADSDRAVRIWDAETGRKLDQFNMDQAVAAVAPDPGGQRALVVTRSRSIVVVSLADGTVESQLLGHAGEVNGASWSPNGRFIASSSLDGTARIWNPDSGEVLAVLDHQGQWVTGVSYAPDGRDVLTARGDGSLLVWRMPEFKGGLPALGRLVRCRVPYAIDAEGVTSSKPDPKSCP